MSSIATDGPSALMWLGTMLTFTAAALQVWTRSIIASSGRSWAVTITRSTSRLSGQVAEVDLVEAAEVREPGLDLGALR